MGKKPKQRLNFLQRIRGWSPQYVFIVTLICGLFVLLTSCALDVFKLKTPATAPFVDPPFLAREVGYGAAVNWSLTYIILFPLAACLMAGVLQRVPATLRMLAKQGMVRNAATLEKVAATPFVEVWEAGTPTRKRAVIALAVVLPAMLSLGEWCRNNLWRLLFNTPMANAPDYDWGLAGLIYHWSLG